MRLRVRRLDAGLPLPSYARPGDAGLDLFSAEEVSVKPGERAAIATGLAVEIPPGYAGFVHARSGRALREGLALANAPGLIDSGYRGEVKVIVVNLDAADVVHVRRGDKVAQLVIQPVESAELVEVDDLEASERGAGGFGSTGR
ncbi:MAG TPA: dUTP diphosphatase [Actinomycetota bacterium]|nr:dUTP diphosphatase [Actinomycetota bacterium]